MLKKIALALLVVLIIIQFIRPERNESAQLITAEDISKSQYAIPDDVHQLLIKKCYDCHSNHTNYPAYYAVQPIAWWLAHHIAEGKDELNFSIFTTYPEKKALHKLEEVGEVVNDKSMPLKSYTMLHPETALTAEDQSLINAWLKTLPLESDHH